MHRAIAARTFVRVSAKAVGPQTEHERGGARSVASVLALVALLALVAALVLPTLERIRYAQPLDEGAYLAAVQRIHSDGLGALPATFREYVATPERWILPSPLRVGHTLVASAWCSIFGASFQALSWLSLASHLALVAIVWAMTRRAKGELAAIGVAALVAFSSLGLGLSRRALLDPHAAAWLALACWAFLESLGSFDSGGSGASRADSTVRDARRSASSASGPDAHSVNEGRRRASSARALSMWRALFVVAFAAAVLVREASILWLVPLALVGGCELALKRSAVNPLALLALLAAPIVLVALALVTAAGGVEPLLATVRTVRASLATNAYAREQMSGPWFRYVVDLALLSPGIVLPALLAAGAFAASAARASVERSFERRWLVIALGALAALAFVEKDARYALVLYVPAALGAWSAFEVATAWLAGRLGVARTRALALVIVALVAASEVRSYRYLFVERALYDPVTSSLVRLRGLFRGPRDS